MAKTFMGVRLRSLRAERGLTQVALAQALGLSPSYLNQLEQDQRPLTVAVLLKIHRTLGVDIQQFSEDEEARLLAQLRDAMAENPGQLDVPLPELREVAAKLPQVAQLLLALHERHQADMQRLEAMSAELGDGRGSFTPPRPVPFEAVRDFFFSHRNYFDGLDRAGEALAGQAMVDTGMALDGTGGDMARLAAWLRERLLARHGVRVLTVREGHGLAGRASPGTGLGREHLRQFDPRERSLQLANGLLPGQQAFQLATQLALLELDSSISALVAAARWDDDSAPRLARIGLANYAAGAMLLPYGRFWQAAEMWRYDIDRLARHFGVGFETVCHRLSTLQRVDAPGVPFFFVRVDRAGNISKRQSATHFHFSKTGGTCPLWNVYEAFAQPGRIVPQLAAMPDGRAYLWIARTVSHDQAGWGLPSKTFSIGLGCDVQHASRLVYSQGLDLRQPEAATPIGMGCKVCERNDCPQRAFPFVGKPLRVNDHVASFAPYAVMSRPEGDYKAPGRIQP